MSTRQTLTATVGAGCCAVLLAFVPQFEGTVLRGYKDPIGIVTACTGHTKTAILGKPYTQAECEQLLIDDLLEHAAPVLNCAPVLKNNPYKLAASISFAFNVGVNAFCTSTYRKKLNALDPTACSELSRWTKAGGQVLPGLVKRRAIERAMCEGRLG